MPNNRNRLRQLLRSTQYLQGIPGGGARQQMTVRCPTQPRCKCYRCGGNHFQANVDSKIANTIIVARRDTSLRSAEANQGDRSSIYCARGRNRRREHTTYMATTMTIRHTAANNYSMSADGSPHLRSWLRWS